MSEQELRNAYKEAAETPARGDGKDITARLAFKKILNAHFQPQYDEIHYELLKHREPSRLHQLIRTEFAKRPNAESFLLARLPIETDIETQADILQILGHLRSVSSAGLARKFLQHDVARHREVALFVLGWVGTEEDIHLLTHHMLSEVESRLRITAASAHRQIAYRLPELKGKLINSLRLAFEKETNDEVIPWIIIMIETIWPKKLGLLESKDNPDVWTGDLERAKQKTAEFLKSLPTIPRQ